MILLFLHTKFIKKIKHLNFIIEKVKSTYSKKTTTLRYSIPKLEIKINNDINQIVLNYIIGKLYKSNICFDLYNNIIEPSFKDLKEIKK